MAKKHYFHVARTQVCKPEQFIYETLHKSRKAQQYLMRIVVQVCCGKKKTLLLNPTLSFIFLFLFRNSFISLEQYCFDRKLKCCSKMEKFETSFVWSHCKVLFQPPSIFYMKHQHETMRFK